MMDKVEGWAGAGDILGHPRWQESLVGRSLNLALLLMSAHLRILLLALLPLAGSVVAKADERLPTFGLYVIGKARTDLLADLLPTLSRLGYAEIAARELTGEHLPVAILRNAEDDELQAVVGRGCVLLEFNAAATPFGTERMAAVAQLSTLHDKLEQYLSKLQEPRPRLLTEVPIPVGCPTEF